ncbi:MAG: FHA domain-containing protein, partial [Oligoflexales bacterium]|nr:FHA domain-containing protein [Oligoflexales bacterium]
MSFLIIERGIQAGERIPLTSFPVTCGRDPSNLVILSDSEVSRFHFRIKKRGHLYILEDMESKNGTYVNGDRVLNTTLHNQDRILVGNMEILFVASQPNIQITNEILNFDMHVAEDLGLQGPIDLDQEIGSERFKPVRLDPLSLINSIPNDEKIIKDIFEHHGNLMVIDDLSEASHSLLKIVGKLIPYASRAALFLWSESSRQLVPFASRNFQNVLPFLLSQRALEDSVSRQQCILLSAKNKGGNQSRNRVVFPMTHNGITVCLIHVESDDSRIEFNERDLSIVQSVLSRSSPILESMV